MPERTFLLLPLPLLLRLLLFLAFAGWASAIPAFAVTARLIDRSGFDQNHTTLDLRPGIEYRVAPKADAVNPDAVWALPDSGFTVMEAGQSLDVPEGAVVLGRIALEVTQVRDPDYLQFPSTRLDRVQVWSRNPGADWRHGEGGDLVALRHWPQMGPFPAFELPDRMPAIQIVFAIEHRGALDMPVEWVPDHVFRFDRLTHALVIGAIGGLALALAVVCALAAWLFRKTEFGFLSVYTLLTGLSLMASNGYAAIYLWPDSPVWNDVSKVFLSMVLISLLLPLVARILRLDVYRPAWHRASALWAGAGFALAVLQALVLPAQWRVVGNVGYLGVTLTLTLLLAIYSVLRSDAMAKLTLFAIVIISVATSLGYWNFSRGNEQGLHMINAATRLTFVLLMLSIAIQRHRFGREVMSRYMAGDRRDPLTGTLNREGFSKELQRIITRARKTKVPDAGLLLCEMRGITTLRAGYGDEVADRVAIALSQAIQGAASQGEILVGRLSFGRFLAIPRYDVSRDDMQSMATRILSRMLGRTDLGAAIQEMKLRIFIAHRTLEGGLVADIEREASRQTESVTRSQIINWL